jgi:hypothetical protein
VGVGGDEFCDGIAHEHGYGQQMQQTGALRRRRRRRRREFNQ